MQFETVERDFVQRSLLLLAQYKQHVMKALPEAEHYDVTLLLNCLTGLVILPYEHCKREQSSRYPTIFEGDNISVTDLPPAWGIDRFTFHKIKIEGKSIEQAHLSLRQMIALIRHSMAHARFENGTMRTPPEGLSIKYQTAPYNSLESIILAVNLTNIHGSTEFVATVPVEPLQKFACLTAQSFLDGLRLDNYLRPYDSLES